MCVASVWLTRVERDDDADGEHGVEGRAEVGGGARATVDELLVAACIHTGQGWGSGYVWVLRGLGLGLGLRLELRVAT